MNDDYTPYIDLFDFPYCVNCKHAIPRAAYECLFSHYREQDDKCEFFEVIARKINTSRKEENSERILPFGQYTLCDRRS